MENKQTTNVVRSAALSTGGHGEIAMQNAMNTGGLSPMPTDQSTRSIGHIDLSDMTTSSRLIVARQDYRGSFVDLAVELQEDIMTVTQKPCRYYDGSQRVEVGYTNRHQLKFVRKRYLVSFDSVSAILGESSRVTRRFLAAIKARAWTINGNPHYALNEILTALAGY